MEYDSLLKRFDPTGLNIGIKKFSYFLKNEIFFFFYLTYLNMGIVIDGVFWLNIVKNRVYLWNEYCSKLFGKLRKEREFWQHCCRNSNKKYERGKVNDVMGGGRKKIWILVMRLLKFLLPEIPAWLPSEVPEGGVTERKPIVATKLLKL